MLKSLPKKARLPLFILVGLLVALGGLSVVKGGGKGGKPVPMGREARAARNAELEPWLIKLHGGISANVAQQELVSRVAQAINTRTDAKNAPQPLKFYLLAEPNVINVFAFSSGHVYVTTALVNRMKTEGELAAALAHGAAHVLALHHLELPEAPAPQVLRYTTQEELAADAYTVKIMADAGYSPEAYLNMFSVLTEAYHAGADTQLFTTHPSTGNRLEQVVHAIQKLYPQGIPAVLSK